MTQSASPKWQTNMRSGRAHLVLGRKPVCDAPTPQGGVTWYPRGRGQALCPDCRTLELAKLAVRR